MALKDIQLLTLGGTGAVNFSVAPNPGIVQGSQNLIQRIVKRLLTLKGSNLFNSNLGSSFYSLIGTVNLNEVEEIKEILPVYVKNVTTQLKNEQQEEQIQGIQFEPNELLSDIILVDAKFDDILLGWLVTLKVITGANTSFTITI